MAETDSDIAEWEAEQWSFPYNQPSMLDLKNYIIELRDRAKSVLSGVPTPQRFAESDVLNSVAYDLEELLGLEHPE